MSLIYNATFDKNTRKLSFEDRAGNEIYSFIVPERGPAVDDITKPLTFKATQNGSTVLLRKNGRPTGSFQTSRDGGNTWVDYTLNTAITLNTGDKVSFRAKSDRTSEQNAGDYFQFEMAGKIEAWHNVMSMSRTNDFATYNTTPGTGTFIQLFKDCTSLTKAPVLPATTLASSCYYGMFSGCTSLTEAPVLPATTLASSCYYGMFLGCTSLTEAPVLPATTLADYCYSSMFSGCTSLVKAPELPATTLGERCYQQMFDGCTSLIKAPALPATTLAVFCYGSMFSGCASLAEAPALPATTLSDRCYWFMFEDCTSLTKAPALPATTLAVECYYNMFLGCTSLTEAPVLPATTLADSCYSDMFSGCTSLTEAPVLPVTTLADYCYSSMFSGCTSLVKAPELPATTLSSGCYGGMFNGCISLNEVRCKMPSTISAEGIPTYTGSGTYAWLYGVSSTGTFYTNEDANWPSGASGIPTGWQRVNEEAPAVDDITKPLTFKATQDGSTVSLRKNGSPTGEFQTSRDGGTTWTDYTIGTDITINTGEEVSFRTSADRISAQSSSNYFYFEMTGKIEARHNVMSMYRTNDFATYESVVKYAFSKMFNGCTSLAEAPALPATTLAQSCYSMMFNGCTSLTEAPALPATTLTPSCYSMMFNGCTSLTEAPALPATTLSDRCYSSMFKGCTSLTKAPELPETTLANTCYSNMFNGCTSLTEAPALPATTLAEYCYDSMFNGCTSLTKAPALPATTLAIYCYNSMFKGCTSLTKAPALPTTTLKQDCYREMFNGCSRLTEVRCKMPSSYSSSQISSYASNWLSNVSSTGTFYTNADANWPSGASGIPTGWNRVNEGAPTVDGIRKPLTFRATQDGSTVKLTKEGSPDGSFQTSRDGGNTWTDYTIGTYITLNTGREVSFRAKADRTTDQTVQNYFYFEMTGKIEAWHNAMSLYRTNDFATYSHMVSHAFYKLFLNCTSLTKAPKLPVTTLAHSCYQYMFNGCTSLTKSPALPSTTLAVQCYYSMFSGCTSLTEAPALPATTFAGSCYQYMFRDCTSLTKTPALSATTLANSCYQEMFRNCSNLNEVRCKMSSSYSSNSISTCTLYWLRDVSSTGTFYTNADANWPSGYDGIPQTWTRANIDDYPTT